MSILINKDTKLLVQGITGRDGSFHASKMKAYGTNVVGGISPGKAGENVDGIPVFNTVNDAVKATGANISVIFVPAPFAKDAMMEAADAGIRLIVCITEGVPTLDVVEAYSYIQRKGARLIGPNCPGLISPGKSLVGIMPSMIFREGGTGVISRSGTLTYEVVYNLTESGMGQSTAVGVGGDPVVGLYYRELLEMFENDPERMRQAGCQDFIGKPVLESELMLVLQRQLRLEWIYAGAPPPVPVTGVLPAQLAFRQPAIAQLLQLTRIGHVAGLRRALDQLSATDASAAASCIVVRSLLERFELGILENALMENERAASLD